MPGGERKSARDKVVCSLKSDPIAPDSPPCQTDAVPKKPKAKPRAKRKSMKQNMSAFEQIRYDALNARQKELFNFQKLAATLADYGFNCIKLADDWQGADFLAYHVKGTITLKVQLKSRITIQKKFSGKDIWMAFPYKGYWYVIKHDRLVTKAAEHTDWLQSDSWQTKNGFSSRSINPELLNSLAKNKLGPVYGPNLRTI
jgi:frataxin-like iron-binding protein CyaY